MLHAGVMEGEPTPGVPTVPEEFAQLLTVETKPVLSTVSTAEILRELDAEVMNGPLPSPGTIMQTFDAAAVAEAPAPVTWLGWTAGTWLLLGVGAFLLFGARR